MRHRNWVIFIMAVLLSGCYAGWTGGEDLDGKAREIADSYRYSKYSLREEPVTDPEQDAIRVTLDFFYYRQRKTLSYSRYIIPGKYTSPTYGRFSGVASHAGSDTEAQNGAEDDLLKNILREPLRRIVSEGTVDELLNIMGDEHMRADSLLTLLIQEDPGVKEDILDWEISRYSKWVTPEIDEATLGYLIQRGILDESARAAYHCHAVLVEINEARRTALMARVDTALNLIASAALEQKNMAVFRDIWRGYRPLLSAKLGLNAGSLAIADKPETVISGLKLELARIDRNEPSIRLRALIVDADVKRPAAGASIIVNGSTSKRADAAGLILLDKPFLMSSCLKGDLISARFQFELLRDLSLELSRKGIGDTAWSKDIENSGLTVSFRYEGKARIVGTVPALQRIESGVIFKKLKAVGIRGSLREENYVPVVIRKARIRWSFFNESQRKAVDYHEATITMNLALKKTANYELELSETALLEKIKKYRSSNVTIEFEGKDIGGRPVVVAIKSDGKFIK